MRFEYVPTVEDLTESLTVQQPKKRERLSPAAVEGFVFVMLAVFLTDVAYRGGKADFREQKMAGVQNLWTALVPMLFATTWSVGRTLLSGRFSRPLYAGISKKQIQSIQFRHTFPMLVAGAWFVLANVDSLAVEWRPTSGQLLCAPAAVWLYGRAVVSFAASGSARAAAIWSFKNSPSSKATQVMDLDEDSIKITLGDVSIGYKWSHFLRAVETEHLLMLMSIDEQPLYFAKRCLGDAMAVRDTKSLMQSYVAVVQFFETPAAFPVVMSGQ